MPKTLDRFTLGEALVDADIFQILFANEALPGGESRPVLLKIFTHVKDEGRTTQTRIVSEIRAFAKIGTAPNLVALYSAGVTEGVPWMAFSPASATLSPQIGDTAASPEEIIKVIRDVSRALEAVHAQSLLHNDVKPASILATDRGYMLSDLSLAASPIAEITQQADMVRYAAPEVFSREYGKLSPSTDLYALGHIAYEMALGSRTWRSQFPQVFEAGWRPKDGVNPAKWMAWHCSSQTRLAPANEISKGFPPGLADLISKLTNKDAAQRFKSAGDVAIALRDLMTPPSAAPAPTPPQPPRPFDASRPAAGAAPVRPVSAVPTAASPSRAPAAPGAAGGQTYYVRLRNKQTGPFDLATIQRQAKTGLISRLHQISTDGVNWKPATAVEGVFAG